MLASSVRDRQRSALLWRASRWEGGSDEALLFHLQGPESRNAFRRRRGDDLAWALSALGFKPDEEPERSDVVRRFRDAVRDAHPDHGAESVDASRRMTELTDARRILLSKSRMTNPRRCCSRPAPVPTATRRRWSRSTRRCRREDRRRADGLPLPHRRPPGARSCSGLDPAVRDGAERAGAQAKSAPGVDRSGWPFDGRSDVFHGGGRRAAGRRVGVDQLSAASAGQARETAYRPFPGHKRAVPVRVGHRDALAPGRTSRIHPDRSQQTSPTSGSKAAITGCGTRMRRSVEAVGSWILPCR